jgi:PelA/Pel-15E family pectate lyase
VRAVGCILKGQIIVDGRRTAWCAQHDERTLAPAPARAFEPVSLSGAESVGLVRFLMRIEKPSPEVIRAVRDAVAWFERVRLTGIRIETVRTTEGRDRVVVQDPAAPSLWARFYEIGSNRPIFIGRDSVIRYELSEIERERRGGYRYYGDWPLSLIEEEYPAWAARTAKTCESPSAG